MKKTTNSAEETKQLGRDLAAKLTGGMVVCLHGELGAGKTTFVKGLAEALGVTEEMTSPTFTLMNVHQVPRHKTIKTLVHIDTYRLKDEKELIEIGAEDYIGLPEIVTVVEWPEKIPGLLRNKKMATVTIDHDGYNRTITVTHNDQTNSPPNP